jgi:plastocyanin
MHITKVVLSLFMVLPERQQPLSKVSILVSIVASFMLATAFVAPNIASAQLRLFSEENIPTYISRIPPGASNEGNLHFYPDNFAVPAGTAVGWFNDDPAILHTVTSGNPGDEANSGRIFNSGGLPPSSFFQHTFNEGGTFDYYCQIHPWMTGKVTVSAAFGRGHHFEIRSGTGPVLDLAENDRTVIAFRPITIAPEETTPLTYNVSLIGPDGQTIFSEPFFVRASDLQIELINNATDAGSTTAAATNITTDANAISVYGPDVSDPVTGTYHIRGNLFETSGEYAVRAEIVAIGSERPEERIVDEFRMQVTTPTPQQPQ